MKCAICGNDSQGTPFDDWVRDTFTNFDRLQPGEIICDDCKFWFEQKSEELQLRMGKDKPQKMQNYSHFIVDGEWIPVGKGDKRRIAALLLGGKMPEMAAIAISGQKHIAFRARRNPPGQNAGWVQFEERAVWIEQKRLRDVLEVIERLYAVFSKSEIEPKNMTFVKSFHWQNGLLRMCGRTSSNTTSLIHHYMISAAIAKGRGMERCSLQIFNNAEVKCIMLASWQRSGICTLNYSTALRRNFQKSDCIYERSWN